MLRKLKLEEKHFELASPQQLINLAQQLERIRQEADGARVAGFAAKAFAAMGKARESEDASLRAFAMDPSSREVAAGLAQAVKSAHRRCEALESTSRSFITSITWDLSKYDFTNFTKSQLQHSETFQLPNGINAWLSLHPKGDSRSAEGMAALFFGVDKPATVKWTAQSCTGKVLTAERDFSKNLGEDGKPLGWGWHDFMPISQSNGSITVRILSVELPGSNLRFT